MAQESLNLIERMAVIAEAAAPITGRGIGYKLFVDKLIPSMSTKDMKRVYRLLKEARERDMIEWDWIVDEARAIERVPSWDDPEEFADSVAGQYRRDFWNQQPARVLVVSEKGTVRGLLMPVLNRYGVGFLAVHGFSSATVVHDIANDDDGRPLFLLYVGDYDPSGLYMSECDLPKRLDKYDGDHAVIRRIALTPKQTRSLPSFPASDKKDDPRYRWFVQNYGKRCWELDALDPRELRSCVEREIKKHIEPQAWNRCAAVNKAERDSLAKTLQAWAGKY